MAQDTRPFKDRPELLPGTPAEWWRAPAKNLRTNRLLRQLEEDKLEDDSDTFGGVVATAGTVLVYNGTTWVPTARTNLLDLDDLTDVNLSVVTTNQFLKYNGTEWTNQTFTVALDDLSDVVITTPATGHIVRYNGTNWVNVALAELVSLTQLSDVTISAPANNQVLKYNGSAWVNASFSGVLALDDLTDVIITSPATKETIRYNGTNFVNAALSVDDLSNEATVVRTTQPEGRDIAFGTVTGSKIATTSSQKIAFWGATPVARPASYTIANGTTDRALDVTGDTLAQGLAVLGTLLQDLQSIGVIG